MQTKNIYPRNWSCRTLCWRDWQTSGSVKVVRINKVGNKVGKKVGDKKPLNSRRQKIISEMRDNPNITTAELHNILGVSETAVEKNISFLRDNGYIESTLMKKTLSVILILLFIISIVGNVILYLQLNKVNSNNQDLNNSIVEIRNSISDLENQLSDLQQQLSDSTTKNGELQEKNDSLQSELEQLQSEVKKLQSEKSLSSETTETEFKQEESSSSNTSTTNNNNSSNTPSSNQGNTNGAASSNSFNQDNVGDILNSMFGESHSGEGGPGSMGLHY